MEQKEALRTRIRLLKSQYSKSQKQLLSDTVLARVESSTHFQQAHTIFAYCSLDDEVDTSRFILKWYKEKLILLPKVCGAELTLHPYKGPNSLSPGSFGISEPTTEEFLNYSSIDLALVPGMAFDRKGNRLGRGKGFYDRFFTRINVPIYKVGLAFPFQIVESVPSEDTDVKMDTVCF